MKDKCGICGQDRHQGRCVDRLLVTIKAQRADIKRLNAQITDLTGGGTCPKSTTKPPKESANA